MTAPIRPGPPPTAPLKIIRQKYYAIEAAAGMAAAPHGFPCAKGCAWCCHSPIVVSDADVRLVRDAVTRLAEQDRLSVLDRADAYCDALRTAGVDLDTAGGYDRIARINAYGLLPILERVWPDGGLACPLLAPGDAPGRGSCMIYEDRPAACRVYFARGPEACRPPRTGPVQELDTHGAMQKLINVLHLRSVGILGVELPRMFRLHVVQ